MRPPVIRRARARGGWVVTFEVGGGPPTEAVTETWWAAFALRRAFLREAAARRRGPGR